MQRSTILAAVLLGGAMLTARHAGAGEPAGGVARSRLGLARVHGTTRGHQRKVVWLNGAWVVAYSNEQGSHLRLSRDGRQWGEPVTFHTNKTSSSYTFVVWSQRLFLFYTDFRPDSPQRQWQWQGDGVVVREVAVRKEGPPEVKGEPAPVLIDPQGTDFYISAAAGPDGTFWVQSRHVDRSLPDRQVSHSDTRLTHTTAPGRLTEWTKPVYPLPVRVKKGSVVPLIVPLPGGSACAFARTYGEVETRANLLWANRFDGKRWGERPSRISRMTAVQGDDRRLSAVLDAASGILHLVYIDSEGALRHRRWRPPYGEAQWQPVLSRPGTVVHAAPVHCAVASLDPHARPPRVHVVFGRELHVGRDRRERTGELRLASYDGRGWQVGETPVSEPGSTDNWYPNVAAEVTPAGELGVLYLRGLRKGRYQVQFSLLRLRSAER